MNIISIKMWVFSRSSSQTEWGYLRVLPWTLSGHYLYNQNTPENNVLFLQSDCALPSDILHGGAGLYSAPGFRRKVILRWVVNYILAFINLLFDMVYLNWLLWYTRTIFIQLVHFGIYNLISLYNQHIFLVSFPKRLFHLFEKYCWLLYYLASDHAAIYHQEWQYCWQ